MFEYRITKYDPALRDSNGAYTQDEWTAFSDIGCSFGGMVLTREEYERVEGAYVTTALAFLREAAVSALEVAGFENHGSVSVLFDAGSVLPLEQAGEIILRVLREEFWCRLEGVGAFVHLGYDYYMYIGVPQACPEAELLARRLGLFVEPFCSPVSNRLVSPVPEVPRAQAGDPCSPRQQLRDG